MIALTAWFSVRSKNNQFIFVGVENQLAIRSRFPIPMESILNSSVNVTASSNASSKCHVFAEMMPPKVKKFYKFQILPKLKVKVPFDRLSLLAVLDRNMTVFENFLSVLLAVLVGDFSGLILNKGYYEDICLFFFCVVTASCQYSLLKSVQPDSASPTHGINRIIVFSRPVYFILCCALALALEAASDCGKCLNSFSFYGETFPTREHLGIAKDGVYLFILFFPAIFVLGLLPQINTFCMYIFEQVKSKQKLNGTFLKMDQPRTLFRSFLVFSNKQNNFYIKSMWKKCPSSKKRRDLNPQPFELESSPITTGPIKRSFHSLRLKSKNDSAWSQIVLPQEIIILNCLPKRRSMLTFFTLWMHWKNFPRIQRFYSISRSTFTSLEATPPRASSPACSAFAGAY